MDFLYFPEDKTEYIPSLFMLALFVIGAILVSRVIINVSKKEQKKAEEKYGDRIALKNEDEDKKK